MNKRMNVIAVIDIGKTNKKVCLYSQDLKKIDSQYKSIPAIKYQELDVEDIETMESWIIQVLSHYNKDYNIKVISVSTHGATVVCVDRNGNVVLPVIAYTNEVENNVHHRFFEKFGDPDKLQQETATAEIKPLINIAKLLFYAKSRFPQDFKKIHKILFLPQYFTYLFTGKFSADITYAGCHSYLWDFNKHHWSRLASDMGILEYLPSNIKKPTEFLANISYDFSQKTGLSEKTQVSYGIHDSNASLLPYLIIEDHDFILNSTGTWCVAMHPQNELHFETDELGKQVFFNLSAFGKPVKTSIIMAGLEYECIQNFLHKHHNQKYTPEFDIQILEEYLITPHCFILPGLVKGAGQYPDSRFGVLEDNKWYLYEDIIQGKIFPPVFKDREKAYYFLLLSMAAQSKRALEHVGITEDTPIFIEGGFRKNTGYLNILSASFPNNPIYISNLDEATAFGAALIGKALIENKCINDLASYIHIEKIRVKSVNIKGLDHYFKLFRQKLAVLF